MWTLNGHSKHYRQTIVQSSVHCPELSALFTKHCHSKCMLYTEYVIANDGLRPWLALDIALLHLKIPERG